MSEPSQATDPLGSRLARAVFDVGSECVIILDLEGIVIAVNQAFCELYGIEEADTVGFHYMKFSKDFEVRRYGASIDLSGWVTTSALRGETVKDIVQGVKNRANGRHFFGRYACAPFYEDGKLVASIITVLDITEATRAAHALDAALSAAEVGTWRADMKQGKVWVDANYARLCGLSESEIYGVPLEELYQIIHPDDRDRTIEQFKAASTAGLPHEVEYRIVLPDGKIRWLVARGLLVISDSGERNERVGSIVDITDTKETETELERRVTERTAQLQAANEALQGFTYHVAHDLRAPLRSIGSASRMVQEDYGSALPPEAHALLDRQAEAASKLGRLIDDLLKLSRLSQAEMVRKRLDLSALAVEAARQARLAHPHSLVEVEIEPGLTGQADPNLLSLALGNLIENAVKYSPRGGVIGVGRLPEGAYFVRDQGIGIDPKYFEKIFEPFERLHRDDEFQGTGIGLSNVRQVIERHGGRIWVESEPGKGSVFYFTLG